MNKVVSVTYDIENPRKVPTIWRSTLSEIVDAFKNDDLAKLNQIDFVEHIDLEYAKELALNIKNYGETLVSLPEETWDKSECLWKGNCWEVFIDLYTESEGRSDLILSLTVFERNNIFIFQIDNIYVP